MKAYLRPDRQRGQAMVEFALIAIILLMLIFVLIEGARLFQANLTVQHSAREAARYAITGQFEPDCLSATPACADPRLASIKAVARDALAGIPLNDNAGFAEPKWYDVEVYHSEGSASGWDWTTQNAGGPGNAIMIRVSYRVDIITPILESIADTVLVSGVEVLTNERYNQISQSEGSGEPPSVSGAPPPGPTPTPPPPKLEIEKSDSRDPAWVGVPFGYSFLIRNIGTSSATNVTINDTLPAGMLLAPGFTLPAGCSNPSASVVQCNVGTIAGGAATTLSIQVTGSISGTLTNSVTISSDETGVDDSDTEDTTLEIAANEADLELVKAASAALVSAEDLLTYYLVVTNHGPIQATGIVLTDNLPASVNFVSASGAACGHATGLVTCSLDTLNSGISTTVSIVVEPTAEGIITNVAQVAAAEPDPGYWPNSSSVDVEVENSTDLGVTKSASNAPEVGQLMQYTVNVVNNGPADATGITVIDSLPPSVDYQSASFSQGSGACAETNPGSNIVTCSLSGSLASGAGATIVINALPGQQGIVTNLVSVSGSQTDNYSANNTFSLNTRILPRADLAIVNTGPDSSGQSGTAFEYTLAVTNNGPSEVPNVVVSDNLDPSLTLVSLFSDRGSCGVSGQLVTCNLGTMANGARATIRITVIPTQLRSDPLGNTATVQGDGNDPDPTNNSSTFTFNITAPNTYISLSPVCGEPGTNVEISGSGWPKDKNYDDYIEWLPVGTGAAQQLTPSPITNNVLSPDWTIARTVPSNAADGIHTIRVRRYKNSNNEYTAEATFQIPCPAPNLQVNSVTVVSPTQVVAGGTMLVEAEIENTGNLGAISQFIVGLYLDPPAPSPSSTHISSTYRTDLVAINGLGSGIARTVVFTVENAFTTSGLHNIYVVVDSDPGPTGKIAERFETDNINSTTVDVDQGPAPTPTLTPTAGPSPTPTATPRAPGSIYGIVSGPGPGGRIQPQQFARVVVLNGTSIIGTAETNSRGEYLVDNVPPFDNYTVTVCISIEGVPYSDIVTGVNVPVGGATREDFVLSQQPCS